MELLHELENERLDLNEEPIDQTAGDVGPEHPANVNWEKEKHIGLGYKPPIIQTLRLNLRGAIANKMRWKSHNELQVMTSRGIQCWSLDTRSYHRLITHAMN